MIIAQPQCLLVLLAALVQDAQGLVAQHHLGLVGPVQGAGAVALGGHEAQASRQHEHPVDGLHFRQLPPQVHLDNPLVDRLQVGRLGGLIRVRDPVRAVPGLSLPFFAVACIWLLWGAGFLGVALGLVYVGAVLSLRHI